MNNLRRILAGFTGGGIYLGEDSGPPPTSPDDFVGQLKELRRTNWTFVMVYCAVLIVLFAALLAMAAAFAGSPAIVAALFTGSGVTIAWTVVRIERLWRDAIRAGIFLALAGKLSDDELRAIAMILFNQWFGVSPVKQEPNAVTRIAPASPG